MKKRFFWVLLVAAVAVGYLAGYLVFSDAFFTRHESRETPEQALSDTEPMESPADDTPAASSMPESPVQESVQNRGEDDIYRMFSVDEHGYLALDKSTRLNIEKLTALNTPEELEEKLQRLATVLPPTAHRDLVYLIQSYNEYIIAAKETYPPGVEVETVEEAVAELDGLHDLREKHFGAEVAEAFFGEEERLSRQLLKLMALEAHEDMTMEEKAYWAQQLLQSSPELSAVNDPERGEATESTKEEHPED